MCICHSSGAYPRVAPYWTQLQAQASLRIVRKARSLRLNYKYQTRIGTQVAGSNECSSLQCCNNNNQAPRPTFRPEPFLAAANTLAYFGGAPLTNEQSFLNVDAQTRP